MECLVGLRIPFVLCNRPIKKYQRTHSSSKNASDMLAEYIRLSVVSRTSDSIIASVFRNASRLSAFFSSLDQRFDLPEIEDEFMLVEVSKTRTPVLLSAMDAISE